MYTVHFIFNEPLACWPAYLPGGLFLFTVFWNKHILFSICMSSACIRDVPRGSISNISILGYLIFKISDDSSSNLKENGYEEIITEQQSATC